MSESSKKNKKSEDSSESIIQPPSNDVNKEDPHETLTDEESKSESGSGSDSSSSDDDTDKADASPLNPDAPPKSEESESEKEEEKILVEKKLSIEKEKNRPSNDSSTDRSDEENVMPTKPAQRPIGKEKESSDMISVSDVNTDQRKGEKIFKMAKSFLSSDDSIQEISTKEVLEDDSDQGTDYSYESNHMVPSSDEEEEKPSKHKRSKKSPKKGRESKTAGITSPQSEIKTVKAEPIGAAKSEQDVTKKPKKSVTKAGEPLMEEGKKPKKPLLSKSSTPEHKSEEATKESSIPCKAVVQTKEKESVPDEADSQPSSPPTVVPEPALSEKISKDPDEAAAEKIPHSQLSVLPCVAEQDKTTSSKSISSGEAEEVAVPKASGSSTKDPSSFISDKIIEQVKTIRSKYATKMLSKKTSALEERSSLPSSPSQCVTAVDDQGSQSSSKSSKKKSKKTARVSEEAVHATASNSILVEEPELSSKSSSSKTSKPVSESEVATTSATDKETEKKSSKNKSKSKSLPEKVALPNSSPKKNQKSSKSTHAKTSSSNKPSKTISDSDMVAKTPKSQAMCIVQSTSTIVSESVTTKKSSKDVHKTESLSDGSSSSKKKSKSSSSSSRDKNASRSSSKSDGKKIPSTLTENRKSSNQTQPEENTKTSSSKKISKIPSSSSTLQVLFPIKPDHTPTSSQKERATTSGLSTYTTKSSKDKKSIQPRADPCGEETQLETPTSSMKRKRKSDVDSSRHLGYESDVGQMSTDEDTASIKSSVKTVREENASALGKAKIGQPKRDLTKKTKDDQKQCPHCKLYFSPKELINHIRQVHKSWHCAFCNEEMKIPSLRNHLKDNKCPRLPDEMRKEQFHVTSKKRTCPVRQCSFSSDKWEDFQKHFVQNHPNIGKSFFYPGESPPTLSTTNINPSSFSKSSSISITKPYTLSSTSVHQIKQSDDRKMPLKLMFSTPGTKIESLKSECKTSGFQGVQRITLEEWGMYSIFPVFVKVFHESGLAESGGVVVSYNATNVSIKQDQKLYKRLEITKIPMIAEHEVVGNYADGKVFMLSRKCTDANESIMDFEADHHEPTNKPREQMAKEIMDNIPNIIKDVGNNFASDIDGSLFEPNHKGWNLNSLDNDLAFANVFTFMYNNGIEDQIVSPGTNTPFLYIGKYGTLSTLQKEDGNLHSITYLHYGAPKVWYIFRPEDARRIEECMDKACKVLSKSCEGILRHKQLIPHPSLFDKWNIPYSTVYQEAKQYIVFAPGAYRMGVNLGFNVAEAINFHTKETMQHFKMERYTCYCATVPHLLPRNRLVAKHEPEKYDAFIAGKNMDRYPFSNVMVKALNDYERRVEYHKKHLEWRKKNDGVNPKTGHHYKPIPAGFERKFERLDLTKKSTQRKDEKEESEEGTDKDYESNSEYGMNDKTKTEHQPPKATPAHKRKRDLLSSSSSSSDDDFISNRKKRGK